MKIRLGSSLILSCIIVGIVVLFYCGPSREGQVPITTSSKVALKYYLNGIELNDKLLYSEARDNFKKAVEADSQFAMAHLYLGLLAYTTPTTLQEIDKALELSRNVSEGERLIIEGYKAGSNRQFMQQQEIFRDLVQKYPNDARAHHYLAMNYFILQDYNQAIGEYRRVLQVDPKFSQAYNQLGYCHRYLENYREAESAFKQYIDLVPNDPNPYDSYADLLMKMGEFQNSIKMFKKALALEPGFTSSYIGIATNLVFLDRPQAAREYLNQLIESSPALAKEREILYAFAGISLFEQQYDSALAELRKYQDICREIGDTSRMAESMNYAGTIHWYTGEYQSSLEQHQKAVQLVETSRLSDDVKKNMGTLLHFFLARNAISQNQLGLAKKEIELFEKSVNRTENRLQTLLYHQLLAMIALEEKKYDTALGELRRSNLQDPFNLYRMAITYRAKGDRAQALKYCEKAANFNTANNMGYALIRADAQKLLNILKSAS